MNDDISKVVEGIEHKVHSLCLINKKIKHENEHLRNQIVELKIDIETSKEQIDELENKIKIIKLSKTIENKRELTDTKLKINELVREIDRCIQMLNQ
ncbi:MAG: hypothetical protein PHI36_06595 [Bacteroidales bacterium]|nr:hypothetical protein [Bacteroidales bacterium]